MSNAKAYVLGEPFQSIKAAGRMSDAINRHCAAQAAEIESLRAEKARLEHELAGYATSATQDMNDIVQQGLVMDELRAQVAELREALLGLEGYVSGYCSTINPRFEEDVPQIVAKARAIIARATEEEPKG